MSGLEIAAGIAGLISFTSRIIEMLTGLTSAIPKSTRLLTSLLNLRHVLERVSSEFSRTIGVLQQSELNITSSLLRKCLEDIELTCQEYDVLLQKIRKRRGGFRQMKWKTSESDRREMDTRLEAGKSTLQLLLSSITYVNPSGAFSRSALQDTQAYTPSAKRANDKHVAEDHLRHIRRQIQVRPSG